MTAMRCLTLMLVCLAASALARSKAKSTSFKKHLLDSKGVNSITHASAPPVQPAAKSTAKPAEPEDVDDDVYRTDSSGCPRAFQKRCRCLMAMYQRREKYVVNCTNTGFTDVSVLTALPDNTEVLIFTGNFLSRLPPNVFGTESNFEDMVAIDMSNNAIRDIDGQAFHRVSSVRTLILNHNNLSIVEKQHHPRVFSNFVSLETLHLTNAFSEAVDSDWYMASLEIIFQASMLTRLTKLHLEQNEIWNFRDPRTFCHLPSLEHLYLGSNRLTGLRLDLTCLRELSFLDLEYNSIRRLDANATSLLDRLAARNRDFTVKLTGNPFVCDCRIRPLHDWLMHTQTRVLEHERYQCFSGRPAENRGAPLMQLERTECAAEAAAPARASAATAVLAVFVFVICVLLGVVIYLQRHRLVRGAKSVPPQLQTAIQNVKRARQYTNIEREEQAPEVSV